MGREDFITRGRPPTPSPPPPCPIVGLSASAGGLAAFQACFVGMPATTIRSRSNWPAGRPHHRHAAEDASYEVVRDDIKRFEEAVRLVKPK